MGTETSLLQFVSNVLQIINLSANYFLQWFWSEKKNSENIKGHHRVRS